MPKFQNHKLFAAVFSLCCKKRSEREAAWVYTGMMQGFEARSLSFPSYNLGTTPTKLPRSEITVYIRSEETLNFSTNFQKIVIVTRCI